MKAHVVSEESSASAAAVYAFASQMDKLPQWASGLAQGIEHEGGRWFAASPMGRVEIEMVAPNDLGVLDHVVTLPDGKKVLNAMRVTPAGDGSVLTFTVLRQPGTDDAAFEADVAHVRKDLRALSTLLQTKPRS